MTATPTQYAVQKRREICRSPIQAPQQKLRTQTCRCTNSAISNRPCTRKTEATNQDLYVNSTPTKYARQMRQQTCSPPSHIPRHRLCMQPSKRTDSAATSIRRSSSKTWHVSASGVVGVPTSTGYLPTLTEEAAFHNTCNTTDRGRPLRDCSMCILCSKWEFSCRIRLVQHLAASYYKTFISLDQLRVQQ